MNIARREGELQPLEHRVRFVKSRVDERDRTRRQIPFARDRLQHLKDFPRLISLPDACEQVASE